MNLNAYLCSNIQADIISTFNNSELVNYIDLNIEYGDKYTTRIFILLVAIIYLYYYNSLNYIILLCRIYPL
jgi:hypothetical protein